ncbi:TadE family protein [Paenibacillus sp. FJAT-26967]|uniref:TadE family protein n=1 Tax=Paenibacillus sp. FJAT-26967 TaxID=1729690 RepID=UPI000837C7CE|nr:TadE family protein [Paenibacillus sp. FJAT-26967]
MKWLRNERGSQAIELIGVLPLFLLMILIVWQFALAASTAITAKAAAMEGARAAMTEDIMDTDYDIAARNIATGYVVKEVSRSYSGGGDNTYVTVSVTLEAPLLTNSQLFDTTGLSIPITSEVTIRKEPKEDP